MKKSNLIYKDIDGLIHDYSLSNESIYVVDQFLRVLAKNYPESEKSNYLIYQFLNKLAIEFKSATRSRLKQYHREQNTWRKEMIAQGL